MEAQVWTLIALLGGSYLTMVVFLGGRITRLEQRFDRFEDRLDRLIERIERTDTKLDDHLRPHVG